MMRNTYKHKLTKSYTMGNENNLNRPRGRAKRMQILRTIMERTDPDMQAAAVMEQLKIWEMCLSARHDYLQSLGLE